MRATLTAHYRLAASLDLDVMNKIVPDTQILFAEANAGQWSETTLDGFLSANGSALSGPEKSRLISDLENGDTCENVPGIDGSIFTVMVAGGEEIPSVTDSMSAAERADWKEIGRRTQGI